MGRTVTNEEMESRKRIASLQSELGEVINKVAVGYGHEITYGELICALSRVMVRWSEHNWMNELKER